MMIFFMRRGVYLYDLWRQLYAQLDFDDQINNLANAGFDTADRLLEASSEKLSEVAGIDKETAEQLHVAVREQVEAAQKASLAALEENVDEIKEEESKQNDVPNESNL